MSDKKIELFSAFRHLLPADYENWLEQMAVEGWHIDHFGQWSSVCMTLQRGEPKKYRFVYDPQVSPRKEYIATYEQFGWEYLGRMASAHIWRIEYEDERPQAFSDREGLVDRNRRNLIAVAVSFFIFLVAVIAIGLALGFASDTLSAGDRTQLVIAEIFFGVIWLALGYIMFLMWKNRMR